MTFDAEDGTKGPSAGHVHCMLSWSRNATSGWQWVDAKGGLAALKEFIPKGKYPGWESHVCFAAHTPLRMADGSTRVYYMGTNELARVSAFGYPKPLCLCSCVCVCS